MIASSAPQSHLQIWNLRPAESSCFFFLKLFITQDLNKALLIADEDKANCQWEADIDQFELDVIKGAYNVSAIFIAKDHAPGMQEKNFPPEADRKKMTDTFNKYYNDEWKKMIKYNVCKHSCNLAAFSFYFLLFLPYQPLAIIKNPFTLLKQMGKGGRGLRPQM